MNKKYLMFFILLIFYTCMNGQIKYAINAQNGLKNGITTEQQRLIFENSKIFPNHTMLSIAIIKKGVVRFYGIKIRSDSILSIENRDNIFEIGSISKVFTATLLADFVITGKLQLSDEIKNYAYLKNDSKITFEELANHTSGLPRLPSNLNLFIADPENPYKDYDEEKLKEYLAKKLEISQNPGEKHEYSNLGMGLLGFLLSKIDSTSYEKLLQTKIFSKYNMLNSTTKRSKIYNKLIKGLDKNGNEVPNWDLNALAGAGAILSNVKDLSEFSKAQFNNQNKELVLTSKPTFSISNNMSIGLGWHIIKAKSEANLMWHNGGTGGYSSSIAIDKERKNAVIILSNVSAFNKNMKNIDDLCFKLMKTLEHQQ